MHAIFVLKVLFRCCYYVGVSVKKTLKTVALHLKEPGLRLCASFQILFALFLPAMVSAGNKA